MTNILAILAAAVATASPTNFAEPRELVLQDPLLNVTNQVNYDVDWNYTRDGGAWYLKNTGAPSHLYYAGVLQQTDAGGSYDLGLQTAWKFQTNITTKICLLDSGVETNHPDLGYIKWNRFDTLPGAVYRTSDHATRLAGSIAAQWNNIGSAGIGQPIEMMDVVTDFSEASLARGMAWAITNGAQIINCSWGFSSPPASLKPIMEEGVKRGIVFVCAVPNNPDNLDVTVDYPTSWGLSNVVSVNNLDRCGNVYWSATGKSISVSAPGRVIWTTCSGGRYCYTSGTSHAAAITSGTLALASSYFCCSVPESVNWVLSQCKKSGGRLSLTNTFNQELRLAQDGATLSFPPQREALVIERSEDLVCWANYAVTTNTSIKIGQGFYRARSQGAGREASTP